MRKGDQVGVGGEVVAGAPTVGVDQVETHPAGVEVELVGHGLPC
jgi:hypothetical protein